MQTPAPAVTRPAPPRRGSKLLNGFLILLGLAVIGFAIYTEVRSSRLQSRYFSSAVRDMKFVLEPGPSASVRFPQDGP